MITVCSVPRTSEGSHEKPPKPAERLKPHKQQIANAVKSKNEGIGESVFRRDSELFRFDGIEELVL